MIIPSTTKVKDGIFLTPTCGLVGNKRLVIETENLRHIVEVWVLYNETPKCVVYPIVEVCNGNLHSPVVFIVDLHMPVHPNRAHVVCALQQGRVVFPWSVYALHLYDFGVTPVKTSFRNVIFGTFSFGWMRKVVYLGILFGLVFIPSISHVCEYCLN